MDENLLQEEISGLNGALTISPVEIIKADESRVSSHAYLLRKGSVGILLWSAGQCIYPTRWGVRISPSGGIHTVVCLCGCQQSCMDNETLITTIRVLDVFLQSQGITTVLVRRPPLFDDLYTRFLEAGGHEGLELIKEWPIEIIDRKINENDD